MTQYVLAAFQVEAQHVVHGNIFNPAIVTQLNVNGIQINNRINSRQFPVLPGFSQYLDLIGDGADRARRNLYPVNIPERVC